MASLRAVRRAPITARSPLTALQSPGIVLLISGSTGVPKPVFRTTPSLLAGTTARLKALELEPGDGVIFGASFAHGHGLTRLLSAMLLGGPLALLDPLDHRAALAALPYPRSSGGRPPPTLQTCLGGAHSRGPRALRESAWCPAKFHVAFSTGFSIALACRSARTIHRARRGASRSTVGRRLASGSARSDVLCQVWTSVSAITLTIPSHPTRLAAYGPGARGKWRGTASRQLWCAQMMLTDGGRCATWAPWRPTDD